MTEEQAEYITDAVEMLGAGCKHEPRRIETERDKAFFKLIKYLNENNMQGAAPEIYDFGELGLLRIYWRMGWEREWLVVNKPPIELT